MCKAINDQKFELDDVMKKLTDSKNKIMGRTSRGTEEKE